jgi:hypothetical protein
MNLIPVEGNTGLYRDSSSGAILNCSDSDFDSYLQLKQKKAKEIDEFETIKNKVSEIETIKSELSDIKNIMNSILLKLDCNS